MDELSRREFLIGSAAFGAAVLAGPVYAAVAGKKTFTILHTNDMHSNFIGMGPSSDYSPLKTDDDKTTGGVAECRFAIMSSLKPARAPETA